MKIAVVCLTTSKSSVCHNAT